MNQQKVTCPYCEKEIFFASFCEKCGRQIAHNCPLCGNLHLKGTIYCQNSGNSLESYKKLLGMIISLLDNFNSSEEYKEWSEEQRKWGLATIISLILCAIFIVSSVTIMWQYQDIIKILAICSGGALITSLASVTESRKTHRHALERYLKARGLPENNLFENVTYNYQDDRYGYLKDQIAMCQMIIKPAEKS